MLESTPWMKIAQASILEIRKIDTKTPIIVGGNHWSSAYRWLEVSNDLKYLYDPANNLILKPIFILMKTDLEFIVVRMTKRRHINILV